MTEIKNNNCKEYTLSETCDFLRENDFFAILTHTSPDGDTLGASYALAFILQKMGKKAKVICPDEIPQKYSYFTDKFTPDTFNEKTVVSVDVADEKLLGSIREKYEGRVDLNIDHHVSNSHYANALFLEEKASAACECVYDIMKELSVENDDVIASALFTGIATDTGSFKYTNVTSKTHLIAADLYNYNIDAAEINRKMFDTKSKSRLQIESTAVNNAEYCFDDKCIILTVTLDMLRQSGCTDEDLEGLAVISRTVEGVLVGVSIKQREENLYKISVRTYPPVDASAICKKLGGGGHKNAAACMLSGTLDEVKKEILSAVKETLEGN